METSQKRKRKSGSQFFSSWQIPHEIRLKNSLPLNKQWNKLFLKVLIINHKSSTAHAPLIICILVFVQSTSTWEQIESIDVGIQGRGLMNHVLLNRTSHSGREITKSLKRRKSRLYHLLNVDVVLDSNLSYFPLEPEVVNLIWDPNGCVMKLTIFLCITQEEKSPLDWKWGPSYWHRKAVS